MGMSKAHAALAAALGDVNAAPACHAARATAMRLVLDQAISAAKAAASLVAKKVDAALSAAYDLNAAVGRAEATATRFGTFFVDLVN